MTTLTPRPGWVLRSAARFVLLAAACACLAFLFGLLGRWWWLADLFSHFRVQYFFVLLASALALLAFRHHRLALVAFVAALAIGTSIVRYTGWPLQQALATGADFRFVTFNQHYSNRDPARIGRYLEDVHADVVTMQEVPSRDVVQALAAYLPSYPHVYADAPFPYGAVMFSRWPIVDARTIELASNGARAALVVIDRNGTRITVVGVHLRWPMGPGNSHLRDAELAKLIAATREIQGPLLIGGDMNITPWSPVFRHRVDESPLKDCARGMGITHTWPARFAPLGIRIDQCLASDHWRVASIDRGPWLGSDHLPTITDLELKTRS